MESLWRDIRYGARVLRKNLGFTLVAALTLALGIGASTAIFSAVYANLLRPLPFNNADRLAVLFRGSPGRSRTPFSEPNFPDFKERNRSFEVLGTFNSGSSRLTGVAEPGHIPAARVTPNSSECSTFKRFAAGLACAIPARRATRADPIVALRYE